MYITYIMCPCGHFTSARFEHLLCHRCHEATKSQLESKELKFYKKGSVEKRKASTNRSRVFKLALEGGNESFTWESFDYSTLLSC